MSHRRSLIAGDIEKIEGQSGTDASETTVFEGFKAYARTF